MQIIAVPGGVVSYLKGKFDLQRDLIYRRIFRDASRVIISFYLIVCTLFL